MNWQYIQGVPWHKVDAYTLDMLNGALGGSEHSIYIEFMAYQLARLKVQKSIIRDILKLWVQHPRVMQEIYDVVEKAYAKALTIEGLNFARTRTPTITTLKPNAQKVYAFVFEHARTNHKNPYAPVELSYGDFVVGTAMAINTVRRALEELEDLGYVILMARGGAVPGLKKGQGQIKKSTYRLLTPKERGGP